LRFQTASDDVADEIRIRAGGEAADGRAHMAQEDRGAPPCRLAPHP